MERGSCINLSYILPPAFLPRDAYKMLSLYPFVMTPPKISVMANLVGLAKSVAYSSTPHLKQLYGQKAWETNLTNLHRNYDGPPWLTSA